MTTTLYTAFVVWKVVSLKAYSALGGRRKRGKLEGIKLLLG
jgi:hypothetical protein